MIAPGITTIKRTPTTEMQVTSIRLETDLKERLRALSGVQGYQSLIREILWDYVERQEQGQRDALKAGGAHRLSASEIRATLPAIAQQEEYCAVTGEVISARSPMLLGLTASGQLVPLSESLAPESLAPESLVPESSSC